MADAAGNGSRGAGPLPWMIAFFVGMGAVVALAVGGAVEPPAAYILMFVPMGLLVPMIRAGEKRSAERGCASPALLRYNRRFIAAGFAYMLGLGIAVFVHKQYPLTAGLTFLLSLLPTLAIFAMIWVMGRYLKEETDEYQRHRMIMAALGGLALVLGLGSFWGFLETFGLAPHVPGWASVPVFAIGLALAQLWMKVRGV